LAYHSKFRYFPPRQTVFPYRDRTILVKDIIPAALSMAGRNMSGRCMAVGRAYDRYHSPKIIPHGTTNPPTLPPTIAPSCLLDLPEPGDPVGPGMTDVTVVGCTDTDPSGSVVLEKDTYVVDADDVEGVEGSGVGEDNSLVVLLVGVSSP
jgi:hypothetical protein